MLAKQYRLIGEHKFKMIFNRGRYVSGRFVTIKYLYSNQDQKAAYPKIGIVVSKKISKYATIRNKIKRQISEIIFTLIDKLPKSIELVIIAKKIPEDFQLLKGDICLLLEKARILV